MVAPHALWICACVSADEAPTWLIYDDLNGEIAWFRVPEQTEPLHLVDAQLAAGGHADPAEVLRWLEGEATDPWAGGGAGWGDLAATDALWRKITRS
ncbi:MAG TPA: hypothetical protein VFE19_12005 [Jatrophihabitantaceae bacterium]|nr:hypothetical protein [Jatrophihabitantaceae bacterium]